jgi:hypothetical protein
MAAWKQFLIAVVILVAAAVAWVRFFPGAPEMLASWGIEWALAATPKPEDAAASGRRQGRGRGPGLQTAVVTRPVTPATINDRLSAIDASFLAVDSPSTPMHVGWVARFDAPEDGPAPPAQEPPPERDHRPTPLRRSPLPVPESARTPMTGRHRTPTSLTIAKPPCEQPLCNVKLTAQKRAQRGTDRASGAYAVGRMCVRNLTFSYQACTGRLHEYPDPADKARWLAQLSFIR